MGTISSGVGLVSGIDTASLIESLITIQSRPKVSLQDQIGRLQAQQTALLDINARLLAFKTAARGFRVNKIFQSTSATSTDPETLTATTTTSAQPGSFTFIVRNLVSTSQRLSRGFATRDQSPLNLDAISFEFGQGRVDRDQLLEDLNGGQGVDRGSIVITDRGGASATIDLTDVVNLSEVVTRINDATAIQVTATIDDDHLVLTDTSGGAGNLVVANGAGDTTATDLGIAASVAADTITGTSIQYLAGGTTLASLNDGNGVLVRNNVTDLTITARDGRTFNVDLGRIDRDIDASTLLSELNDGAGVSIDSDSDTNDIKLVARDGTEFEFDLSGVTTVGGLQSRIAAETGGVITLAIETGDRFKVVDSSGGAGLLQILGTDDNGTTVPDDLGILNEAGVLANEYVGTVVPSTIDEPAATTLQEVVDRINSALDTVGAANGGHIVAAIAADGARLEIRDTVGGGSNLIVTSTAANPDAAAQLGLDTGPTGVANDRVTGERIIAGLNTVLLRSINGGAGTAFAAPGAPPALTGATALADLFGGAGLTTNGDGGLADISITDRLGGSYTLEVDGLGTVQDLIDAFNAATGGNVKLSIEGQALRATDLTGGLAPLDIQDINGASAATELGLAGSHPTGTVLGNDTAPLNPAGLTITDRLGARATVDLSSAESVQDVINLINGAGIGVTAAVNDAGNGIEITDATGGSRNLVIAGDDAAALGLSADVAANTVQGGNLQLQYVSSATLLTDLNYGRGIGTGTFRITDGLGATATVNIGGSERTVRDVIDEINSRGLAVRARINDNGDGLLIEEDPAALGGQTPFVALQVTTVNGTAGADLNLVGQSSTIEGASIDGSYEAVVDLDTGDSLDDVVSKINAAGIPVAAAVVNTGSGANPYRLNLTSGISGSAGDLVIDTGGVSLGLTSISEGRDARVFFGSANPEDALLLTSATNSLDEVIPGVTIDLHEAGTGPVTLTIQRDVETIVASVGAMVDAFNGVIDRIDAYDFFDTETEERGVLLSDPTVALVRTSLYRVATGSSLSTSGPYRYLSQVGITFNGEGKMRFDETRFREAYAADPAGVEAVLATYETTSGGTQEVADGVTIESTDLQFNALGFGNLFDRLLDDLTDSIDGVMKQADNAFGNRIELLNDRIATIDARLEARRDILTRQFASMELILSQLQSQYSSLSGLASNVSLASQRVSVLGG